MNMPVQTKAIFSIGTFQNIFYQSTKDIKMHYIAIIFYTIIKNQNKIYYEISKKNCTYSGQTQL